MQKKYGWIVTAGLVLLTAVAMWGETVRAQNGTRNTFLPLVQLDPSADLTVTRIGVNQSVQNSAESVPLVAGRQSLVRVYLSGEDMAQFSNYTVTVSGRRGALSLGSVESNPITLGGPSAQGDINTTANVVIPGSWADGSVTLTAVVDAANQLSESNESNNALDRTVVFNEVPTLDVKIVPINYTHQGPNNPGFYPGQAVDYISDWLLRAFPVDEVRISYRAPFAYSGNLQEGDSWIELLRATSTIKQMDNVPDYPQFYFSFVPISDGTKSWFPSGGGIAGIGYIGFRESVNLNFGPVLSTATVGAHEIGHNLGRRHSPCGGAAGPDPDYPYGDALIGQYGVDLGESKFWTPSAAYDLMSYCDPQWMSDFTYRGMYDNQRDFGQATANRAAQQDVILVRAQLNDDRTVSLNETYTYNGYPTAVEAVRVLAPGQTAYRVALLGTNGELLGTYPLQVREAADYGISFTHLAAAVPAPDTPVAEVRVLADGAMVAQRTMNTTAMRASVSVETAETTVAVRWGNENTPAAVRYSADDGRTWTTMTVDQTGGSFFMDRAYLENNGRGVYEVILADQARPSALQVIGE